MPTDEQIKHSKVEDLVKSLGEESLKRAHNSVGISFDQMLVYIDKIREPIPPGDINSLLKTYRLMAEMFYTKFEFSLLREIKKQSDTQKQADDAIQRIEELHSNNPAKAALTSATPLLIEDRIIAAIEYQKLIENFPTLLQNALDKLKDEWQRVNMLAVASQTLNENEKLDRSLKAVVEVAAHSVGVEAERIVIIPGNAFALYFFTYLDNFAVLTVPIYSVQAPWEWSIFWHELAGYKVRRLEKTSTIEIIKDKLTTFHKLYKISDEEKRKELLNLITWNNPSSQGYLSDIFSKERLTLDDLGGFEHQFERMLLNLPNNDKFQIYDQIKTDGWCIDWFKELFEDAWSVLAIGEPFLDFFSDVLGRNTARDSRHPPMDVRLSVAKELLILMDPQSELANEPKPMEKFAAQQILNFISLLIASARKYEDPNLQSTTLELFWQRIRDELFKKIRNGIQESIANWSGKFLSADDPARRVRNNAKNFLNTFSDPMLEEMLSKLHEYEANQIKPSYKDLLKSRDYKQLLRLSFSEVDYHTPGDIQLLENGRTYWVKPVDWNSTLWLAQRHPVGKGILPNETTIRDVNQQEDWKIQKADWDTWFKMTL
jgi:hypothetical protein